MSRSSFTGNVDIRLTNLNPPAVAQHRRRLRHLLRSGPSPRRPTRHVSAGTDTDRRPGRLAQRLRRRRLRHRGRLHRHQSQPPSYATVCHHRRLHLHLGNQYRQPRALQNVASTGDIASTWYSPTSFDIHINISDGQAHQVTLYALDWNNVLGNDPS